MLAVAFAANQFFFFEWFAVCHWLEHSGSFFRVLSFFIFLMDHSERDMVGQVWDIFNVLHFLMLFDVFALD